MWGIWNSITKRFVFGIVEATKGRAEREFKRKVGKDTYYKWRYEARRIPPNWKNPKNALWTNS